MAPRKITDNGNDETHDEPIASHTPQEACRRLRKKLVTPLWEQYINGDFSSRVCHFDKTLDLVDASDLQLRTITDPATGKAWAVDIMKLTSPEDLNFMGYLPDFNCYIFRGEDRLLKLFFDFIKPLVSNGHIVHACKVLSHVRMPAGGVPDCLTYKQFAGHVEVMEYAVWLADSLFESGIATVEHEMDPAVVEPIDKPKSGLYNVDSLLDKPGREKGFQQQQQKNGAKQAPKKNIIVASADKSNDDDEAASLALALALEADNARYQLRQKRRSLPPTGRENMAKARAPKRFKSELSDGPTPKAKRSRP